MLNEKQKGELQLKQLLFVFYLNNKKRIGEKRKNEKWILCFVCSLSPTLEMLFKREEEEDFSFVQILGIQGKINTFRG
jgi:hypothetical protein